MVSSVGKVREVPTRHVSRGVCICVVLVIAVTVLSVLKAPVVPLNDPALYEYYGLRLVQGAHLYTDLPEVKLPTLYYVNALWQLAFGSSYVLHTCAEAALNLLAATLFALVLRANRIAQWAPATVLFALFYSLAIDQFNYPEYYAVPLILLAYYLVTLRLYIAAGIALAFATTFWVETPIMLVPLLVREASWLVKRRVAVGFVGTFVLLILALIPHFGVAWLARPLSTWPGFLVGSIAGLASGATVALRLQEIFLHAGLGTLLMLLILVASRPVTEVQRFSLLWLACAVIGALIPPSLFAWYFLPVIPPLVMAIAAYPLSLYSVRRRPIIAVASCVLFIYGLWLDARDTAYLKQYASYALDLGTWIRQKSGDQRTLWTVTYLPELYLTAGALEPYPGAANSVHIVYTKSPQVIGASALQVGTWIRPPDIVAEGGPDQLPPARRNFFVFNPLTKVSHDYVPVCGAVQGLRIRLYADFQLCTALSAAYPSCRC